MYPDHQPIPREMIKEGLYAKGTTDGTLLERRAVLQKTWNDLFAQAPNRTLPMLGVDGGMEWLGEHHVNFFDVAKCVALLKWSQGLAEKQNYAISADKLFLGVSSRVAFFFSTPAHECSPTRERDDDLVKIHHHPRMEGASLVIFGGFAPSSLPLQHGTGAKPKKSANLILHDFDSLPDSKQRQGCSVAIGDHPVETI
ncbi:hypothetical protein EDD16DRAFT_1519923 [Pisolithus croceorrhizus]|nr:hypothetical protein EDD16DRAFT_1519923 [Pisolithus croceorrhizus]